MNGSALEPVGVLLVAIGGYGHYYLRTLLEEVPATRARLAGVVDPQASQARAWPSVAALGVPVCGSIEEYYASGHKADLAVIVSPIQHHVPQACVALAAGSHVLCDKPLGATVQEVRDLLTARDRTGRFVMVGYQWSFSESIQALKRDILEGLFGRPLRFSALCCWPRDLAYYCRNSWAGRLRDPESGRWVLDSPASNAMAHSLHNLLYLAGDRTETSAAPLAVQAELYRAYPVESCDTAACRVTTSGPEVLFYASHVTEAASEPQFRLEFEHGLATFRENGPTIVATNDRGLRRVYGSPDDTPQFQKLFHAIDAVRRPGPILCGVEAAAAHTLVINGIHESVTAAAPLPESLVVDVAEPRRRYVRELAGVLLECYERAALPSEAGVEWAVAGRPVDLRGYDRFPAAERA